jgi:hypothetical protein
LKKASTLGVGDTFQVAHPQQLSANGRPMAQGQTFKVSKVFPQAPYYVISKSGNVDGIFSLPPDAVVLAVGERKPGIEEIEDFLGVRVKAKVVGYRMLWNGRTTLGSLSNRAAAVVKVFMALGVVDFDRKRGVEICERHLDKFYASKSSSSVVFYHAMKELVKRGFIEESLDRGSVPEKLRSAGLG